MEKDFSKLDEETQREIQKLQIYEQGFQELLNQKKAFSFEFEETEYSIKEIEKAEGEVFKIVGNQAIIKYDKKNLIEELNHKLDLIKKRLDLLEKQEKEYSKIIEEIRNELIKKFNNKQ